MKQYEFNKNKKEKSSFDFYAKLLFCSVIFGVVLFFCKLNPDASNYVKNVLNNSCDFNSLSERTTEIINNVKNVYKNVEDSLVWEE